MQVVVDRTVLAASVLALGCAVAGTVRPVLRERLLVTGGLASLVAVGVGGLALAGALGQPSWAVVAALGVLAVAWAVAGQATDSMGIRAGAAALVAGSEVAGFITGDVTPNTAMVVLTVTSATAVLLALAGPLIDQLHAWQRPALALAAGTAAGGIAVALLELPDRTLLVPALIVGSAVSAGSGVVLRSAWASTMAPVLGCTAWVVYASDALGANPQWYTVPLGLTLLVVVGLARQDARRRGADPATRGLVALEMLGIAFLVGAAFVQSVTESLGYVAVAFIMGSGVVVWGALTRVRRRVAAGVIIVLATAVVLVLIPLVSLLPTWQSTGLWLFLLVAGAAALLAATALEKGRALAHGAIDKYARFGSDDWE